MRFFKSNSGATALEFALVLPAVIAFVVGIIQVGYLLWIDNLLHYSVETAARCGAIGSTTYPCAGSDMQTAAKNLFQQAVAITNIPSGTFTPLSPCSGSGLQGSYTVSFLLAVPVTVSANSCYPNFSPL
jgi:Flp pilus assembly protein TadG